MTLESSAPTRIDLAGGTIDIWPLYLFHEGAQTLNVAISLRAHAQIASRSDGCVGIRSLDTGHAIDVSDWSDLPTSGPLALLGNLLRHFRARHLTLTTRCEAPAGAGIAGSSALNVAVCAALARWTNRHHEPEKLLEIAMNIEARAINVPTGAQDYRPALYGGVSAVELCASGVRRVALDVPLEDLERRIVLAYTGEPRNSGTNNWEITKRHIDGDAQVFGCFEQIRDTARTLRQALDARDWSEVGRQIAREWETRKRLAPGVTTPAIESLIASARAAGARAAKVCGAGGGGCLFCFADPELVPQVRRALAEGGARVLDFQIDRDGLLLG
ncbi:MAG: GHMP kinase [Acidobacteria bacterium]|nr:GHMP kinase [Acidobacteriota bacterium]